MAVLLVSVTSIAVVYATYPLPTAHKYVYHINFLCGYLSGTVDANPGTYSTLVNVLDPSYQKTSATVTLEVRDMSGSPGLFSTSEEVVYDSPWAIGCLQIENLSPLSGLPDVGFLTIYSSIKLDVVAQYTVATATTTSISTISIPAETFTP
ncbi:MAG: hypothetical protein ABSB26_00505 [Nitrososphaerales archaeon]|jgi:hypothetical protein